MPAHAAPRVEDGTTGGSAHSGRRTHIIQILRDAQVPLTVTDVASMVGVHPNTARFHLESLVEAGLAVRQVEVSNRRGRHHVLYTGTLPNQTHERAQGYRLLATILTGMIAAKFPDAADDMYAVGYEWGQYLTSRLAPFEVMDEAAIAQRVMDKLDALWFAPELRQSPRPHLLLHNCPFIDIVHSHPRLVCRLHVGMVNGSLAELRSTQRVAELEPFVKPHLCYAWLDPAEKLGDGRVHIQVRDSLDAGAPAGVGDDVDGDVDG